MPLPAGPTRPNFRPPPWAVDPLSVFLTARFGMHGTFRGRSIYLPNTHKPWPLREPRRPASRCLR
ncbi:DUF2071 domain-containing protein [Arthrobacter sp. C152]